MKNCGTKADGFLNSLQSRGIYTFTRKLAEQNLMREPETLVKLLQRLRRNGRILPIRNGFYVIVPVEYRATGCIPADWFIDPLLRSMKTPYYVGLLSAAAIHGASHHAVQAYQVVVPAAHRPVRKGKLHIQFFRFKGMAAAITAPTKTWTGYVPISTPEWTALDLVRFNRQLGGMSSVLTVLTELAEKMTSENVAKAAQQEPELANVQRLGWLLDQAGQESLTAPLATWLATKKPFRVVLDPNTRSRRGECNKRWQVIVNAVLESEA